MLVVIGIYLVRSIATVSAVTRTSYRCHNLSRWGVAFQLGSDRSLQGPHRLVMYQGIVRVFHVS